jgi:large subunit ribosomal protein L10
MERKEKEQIVADVVGLVAGTSGMFFTDFSGLTVEQMTDIRREFRKAGVEYRVAKNTLIRKALEQVGGYDALRDRLVGPTGVAFAYDDPVAPARIIQKFAEKHNKLSLKVCVIEQQVYDGSALADIARMPTRKDMMAAIVGSIQAPLAGVPTVINALMRDLVSVIGEIEKKKAA